jgi:hypothetical protein
MWTLLDSRVEHHWERNMMEVQKRDHVKIIILFYEKTSSFPRSKLNIYLGNLNKGECCLMKY